MKTIHIFAISGMTLLSACGGSGGSGNPSVKYKSFVDMAQEGQTLIGKYWSAGLTPFANMPTNGKATYTGVAAYSDVLNAKYIVENAEVVSKVTLNADFAADEISGKLDNFRDYENKAIAGAVDIKNGKIQGNTIKADLSGQINVTGQGNSSVNGSLAGGFAGPNADAIIGGLNADVSNVGEIYGVFGAEK